MPIDSSIPLQAQAPKPANWAETMMPYVQMAGAMQNIKESQARMPGLEADAANKARSAAAQKWLQDNSAKYTSPDGKVDSVSLVEAFKKAGFPDFAQQYAQQDAKTSSDTPLLAVLKLRLCLLKEPKKQPLIELRPKQLRLSNKP